MFGGLTRLRLRLRSLFLSRAVEHELDEELQYHLQREIDERVDHGSSPKEARYAALRALGPITQSKEECRDMRAVGWIDDLIHDLRYGARALWKNPAFSIVAVVVLALGIGANTVMFSVAYGLLARPLPYADADRVAVVNMNYAARDNVFGTLSVRDYLIWKELNRAFEEPALFRALRLDIAGSEGLPEQVAGVVVTSTFFPTLGVQPLLGRTFAASEDKPGAAALAVLSESFWRRRFSSDSGVLGRTIVLSGAPATVIGVMPSAFQFPRRETEVWTNLVLNPPTRFGPWFYRAVARLKPGVTHEQARAELNDVGIRLARENPYYKAVRLPFLSLRAMLVGVTLKPAIWALAGAVGLVLLIAVANVANLMLARATVREREMAVRLSLGAGRGRLVRQLLTESVLLATMGSVGGFVLAVAGVELIRVWNPGNLPLIDAVRMDWTALAFMAVVTVATGVLFGLAPALGGARASLSSVIKEGGRGGTPGRARSRTRAALVVSEIALSLMLLVGAGLLLRSFLNLQGMTGGFFAPPQRILTMLISPGGSRYDDPKVGLAYYDEVLRRARSLPGIDVAAISDSLPPDRQGDADTFQIEGQTLAPGEMNPVVGAVTASASFFEALDVPLIKGRYFTDQDRQDSAQVAIVSDAFVRRFLPGQEAVGKRIRQGRPWLEIVGVVGNVKYLGLTVDSDPAYYMPLSQSYGRRQYLVVRSSGEAAPLSETLRREIQSIDRNVTLAQIVTMDQSLNASVARPRFNTLLFALFAGIALLLAAVGIYGLIAYWVVQRTHEIGVRMALGAAPRAVMQSVIRQGASLAIVGIAIGLAGAFVLSGLLKTLLFGIGVTDAVTFAAAPLGIMLVVLLATFIPARRATRISPLVALRHD
jgi:putative ABC transport system permease protein